MLALSQLREDLAVVVGFNLFNISVTLLSLFKKWVLFKKVQRAPSPHRRDAAYVLRVVILHLQILVGGV